MSDELDELRAMKDRALHELELVRLHQRGSRQNLTAYGQGQLDALLTVLGAAGVPAEQETRW